MVLAVNSFGISESLVWPFSTAEQRIKSAPRRGIVTKSLAREYMTESPGERWQPISLMVQLRGVHSKDERPNHGGAHKQPACLAAVRRTGRFCEPPLNAGRFIKKPGDNLLSRPYARPMARDA